MGLFRGPLTAVALSMVAIGPIASSSAAAASPTPQTSPSPPVWQSPSSPPTRAWSASTPSSAQKTSPKPSTRQTTNYQLPTINYLPNHPRRRTHLRLNPHLLYRPAGPPHQRPRQRPLVRQLLARRPRRLRNRRLPPPTLGQPPPHLPLHLQPHRTPKRPNPLRPSPHPRLSRRQNHPHQSIVFSLCHCLLSSAPNSRVPHPSPALGRRVGCKPLAPRSSQPTTKLSGAPS